MEPTRSGALTDGATLQTEIDNLRILVKRQQAALSKLEQRLTVSLQGQAQQAPAIEGRGISRSGLLRAGMAVTAGALGVIATGGLTTPTALAANSTAENYLAFGDDPNYTPDPSVGFDASDPQANFSVGVQAFGTSMGVAGRTASASGFGLYGFNAAAKWNAAAILGDAPTGRGVSGSSDTGTGVFGYSTSGTAVSCVSKTGIGLHIVSQSPASPGAVVEQSLGGDALEATSKAGRGAVLSGGIAQLRLIPGSAAKPPKEGEPGDFYVDHNHHLWFCQGASASNWKQLA